MKKLLIAMLAVLPLTAMADYDVERIKKEMIKSELLKINEWKLNEAGNAWMAKHDLSHTVISASTTTTGIMRGVVSEIDVLSAMGDCSELGDIGFEVKDDKRVGTVLADLLTTQKEQTLTVNSVVYTAKIFEVSNNVIFSCSIEPEKSRAEAIPQATKPNKEKVKNYFISDEEVAVKDATWTADNIFKVGVIDNGSNRDGYAGYVCLILQEHGLNDILVRVIDVVKVQQGKWVNLGTAHCK